MVIIWQYLIILSFLGLSACGYHPLLIDDAEVPSNYTYVIGPGDGINITVWGHPDLSGAGTVRPDGKITLPLVEDILASGKTSFELARLIEHVLDQFIRDPSVVVIVTGFQGIEQQQIRIIGQIGGSGGDSGSSRYSGMSLPYQRGMTLLDIIIRIGQIGEFADGNRASIIRRVNGQYQQLGVKIDDLIEDGNMDANVNMLPGDILVIPEAFF